MAGHRRGNTNLLYVIHKIKKHTVNLNFITLLQRSKTLVHCRTWEKQQHAFSL